MASQLIILSIWVVAQVLFGTYILLISKQQIPILKVFRKSVPTPNPANEPMHFYNAFMAGMISFLIALIVFLANMLWGNVGHAIVATVMFGLLSMPMYLVSFNRRVNKGLGNDPNYLGKGSKVDVRIKKIIGTNEGKKIHAICIGVVAGINLIYLMISFI